MRQGRAIRWVAMLSAVATFGASSAGAADQDHEFYTGEILNQRCSAVPADLDYAARRAACRGYVLGVSDALQAAQGAAKDAPAKICLADAEADRVLDHVTSYLSDHPENRRYAAADVVAAALKAAYPCR